MNLKSSVSFLATLAMATGLIPLAKALDHDRVGMLCLQSRSAVERVRVLIEEDASRRVWKAEGLPEALDQMCRNLDQLCLGTLQQREEDYRKEFDQALRWGRAAESAFHEHRPSPALLEAWNISVEWFNDLGDRLDGTQQLARLIVIDDTLPPLPPRRIQIDGRTLASVPEPEPSPTPPRIVSPLPSP